MKKRALIFALLLAVPGMSFAAGNAQKGKEIYDMRCWWCHGENGAGDGPAAERLNPPPRDFTAGAYKWKSTPFDEITPTDEDFAAMIKGDRTHNAVAGWTGMNDTSMPGWADMLNDQDVADVTAYIKSFAELTSPQKGSIDVSKAPASSAEGIEKGKKIFADRCVECHGDEGRGDGTKKLKDDWGFRTWPRNFTKAWSFRVSNDPKEIYRRVTIGIPGTQMPSFADPNSAKKLTDEERWDVANYVASLDAPYKKPGDNTVINAIRVEGELPEKYDDPAWDLAEYKSFYMIPQLIAAERHFTPSLDSISAKAIYNDKEVALLVEWDDRTNSLPGDAKAIEIADGDVFPDAVAVQWPITIPVESEKPYFGMGDAAWPVNIWYWQSPNGAGAPDSVKLLNAKGIKADQRESRDPNEAGLKGIATFNKGTWRVIFKRSLKTNDATKDIQFEEGRFIPLAFAAWDGSNKEVGSKHEMTTWFWILMQPKTGSEVYLWPAAIALVIFGVEILWLVSARKKK